MSVYRGDKERAHTQTASLGPLPNWLLLTVGVFLSSIIMVFLRVQVDGCRDRLRVGRLGRHVGGAHPRRMLV